MSNRYSPKIAARLLFAFAFAFALAAAAAVGCNKQQLAAVICQPGALECLAGGGTNVCSSDGTAWVAGVCPAGEACVAGGGGGDAGCPVGCQAIVCQQGEQRCAEDNISLVQCNATATGWSFVQSCAAVPYEGVCSAGQCYSVCSSQDKSYLGCEYFAVDLDNAYVPCDRDVLGNTIFCDAAGSQFAVVVSNPDPSKTAFVSVTTGPLSGEAPAPKVCGFPDPDPNFVTAAVIPPKGLKIFELPRRDVNGTVLARLAYRVASNIPITVYQFNPLENVDVFSNDASLLLPTHAMDVDYLVMTREQTFDDLKGFLTVVGIDPRPTQVTVTVTARTLAGLGIAAMAPGEQRTFTLERFDVLNIETNAVGADLTGSQITADRPIVVYAGSEAANAPTSTRCNLLTRTCEHDDSVRCGCEEADGPLCSDDEPCTTQALITCCADHLEQQIFPLSAWGDEYVAARSYPRSLERDVWRVMASQDDTRVTLEPPVAQVPSLGGGQWFEFESDTDFLVHASAPVLLGQFLAAQDAPGAGRQEGDAGVGDPSFILAVPIRQFRAAYVFLAPNKYAEDYVTVAYRAGTAALLDGEQVDTRPGARAADVGATGWRAARVPIADGYHDLVCPAGCGVMVHGYDQYVSYGYPGGLNLNERASGP